MEPCARSPGQSNINRFGLDNPVPEPDTGRAQYQRLVENIGEKFVVFSHALSGELTYVSDGIKAVMNLTREEVLGKSWAETFDWLPGSRERAYEAISAICSGESDFGQFEMSYRIADGGVKTIWVSHHPVRDEHGTVLCIDGIVEDITERKRMETDLRIAATAFRTNEGIMVTDRNARIIRVNEGFSRLTGYPAEEVIGHTPAILRSGREAPEFYVRIRQTLEDRGYWQGIHWGRLKDGSVLAQWLQITAVPDDEGEITHYVGTFSEISESKGSEAEIHRLAYYDPVTRLPNRRLLQEQLEQTIVRHRNKGARCALLSIDLDHFKKINGALGQAVGDRVLIETARRLKACMQEGDTVARPGGDEFAFVLSNLSAEIRQAIGETDRKAEKIRAAIARPYEAGGKPFLCTGSIGIAMIENKAETAEGLQEQASLALNRAKHAGRDTQRFFDDEMRIALNEYTTLENALRSAIALGQLELHYQPQFNRDCQMIGAEALLRWQHPDLGPVPPDVFIPIAEENGLIDSIGFWVLENTCAQIQAWAGDPALCEIPIAINVSALQLQKPGFVDQAKQALQEAGIPAWRLKMELTESSLLKDIDNNLEILRALKAHGIKISLDDFGTGHSSLAYLSRLPLDQIKIDRSFVSNLPDSHNDAVIAQTIIAMTQGLGLEVLAEGVETPQQQDFLNELGCHNYQGYLYSRPLPSFEFEAFARSLN